MTAMILLKKFLLAIIEHADHVIEIAVPDELMRAEDQCDHGVSAAEGKQANLRKGQKEIKYTTHSELTNWQQYQRPLQELLHR